MTLPTHLLLSNCCTFLACCRQLVAAAIARWHPEEGLLCLSRFKQRGRAAEDACNIFYYLTYEGAVDLEAIQDPLQRQVKPGPANLRSMHGSPRHATCGELMSQEAGVPVARGQGWGQPVSCQLGTAA